VNAARGDQLKRFQHNLPQGDSRPKCRADMAFSNRLQAILQEGPGLLPVGRKSFVGSGIFEIFLIKNQGNGRASTKSSDAAKPRYHAPIDQKTSSDSSMAAFGPIVRALPHLKSDPGVFVSLMVPFKAPATPLSNDGRCKQ